MAHISDADLNDFLDTFVTSMFQHFPYLSRNHLQSFEGDLLSVDMAWWMERLFSLTNNMAPQSGAMQQNRTTIRSLIAKIHVHVSPCLWPIAILIHRSVVSMV